MAEERKNGDKPRWAADEPTAMWDGEALEQQGLSESPKPGARPDAGAPPQPSPPPASGPRPAAGGLSWPVTIGVAVVVAIAVFFLVRALRG